MTAFWQVSTAWDISKCAHYAYSLQTNSFRYLTPVQLKVLTELPTFSSDCLVQAKTGTGKTLAFLLPTLNAILSQSNVPRGQVAILILSPTRELALQIAKECNSVTTGLKPAIECHTAYGGTSKARELKLFLQGDPKVLVATPGRLNDYLSDEYVAEKFASVRTVILDEADTMLEAGFLPAIKEILRRLPPKSVGWQGMCFSATIPKKIESVLPHVLSPAHTRLSTVDPNQAPTIDRVAQYSLIVPGVVEVYTTLYALLQREYAAAPDNFKVICFGVTANQVALMAALFSNLLEPRGIQTFQLQSRLSQSARTRTTEEFKAVSAGVMFASDVIGRGMDFPNVSLVVQVGLPSNGDQYTHRVGRTARAGNEGRAVILLTQRESFFLRVNRALPIKPYPSGLSDSAQQLSGDTSTALSGVDEEVKAKAYRAWLGFHKTFTKQLQLTNEELVEQANLYAQSLGCPETPSIEKQTVGKMGLKGVRGLNIGPAPDRQGRVGRGRGGGVNGGRGGMSHGQRQSGGDDRSRLNGPGRGRGRGRGGGRGGRVEKNRGS